MTRISGIFGTTSLRCYRLAVRLRNRLFSELVGGGFQEFGKGSTIQLPATIWGESLIGIGTGVHIGPGSWLICLGDKLTGGKAVIQIGDGCSLAGGVTVTAVSGVRIERDVLIGRNVHISDHSHKFDSLDLPVHMQGVTSGSPVVIGEGSWLGQGVVICPGVTIGKNSVVGANSVVKKSIPEGSVAVGAPARVVKSLKI